MRRISLLFDLDETLVLEYASVEAAFLATCRLAEDRYGIDPDLLQRSVRRHAKQLWQASKVYDYCMALGISSWEGLSGGFSGDDENLRYLREWVPSYQRQAWSLALAEHDVDDAGLAKQLTRTYPEERSKRHIVFPEAEEILQILTGDYRLALITNGVSAVQREKLAATRLTDYFELIVVSGEIGIGKPDPAIFQTALEQLNTSAGEAVMIGDSLKRDIAGAQRVGIRAIWVNRSGDPGDNDITPDATISTLTELPKALDQIASPDSA